MFRSISPAGYGLTMLRHFTTLGNYLYEGSIKVGKEVHMKQWLVFSVGMLSLLALLNGCAVYVDPPAGGYVGVGYYRYQSPRYYAPPRHYPAPRPCRWC